MRQGEISDIKMGHRVTQMHTPGRAFAQNDTFICHELAHGTLNMPACDARVRHQNAPLREISHACALLSHPGIMGWRVLKMAHFYVTSWRMSHLGALKMPASDIAPG